MDASKIQEIYAKRKEAADSQASKSESADKHRQSLSGADAVQRAVLKAAEANVKHQEAIANDTEEKLKEVTNSINQLNLTTFNATQPKIADMVENLKSLCKEMSVLSGKFKEVGFEPVSKTMSQLIDKLNELPSKISDMSVKLEKSGNEEKLLKDIAKSIDNLKLDPKIDVKVPKVTVPSIDTSGIERVLSEKLEKEEVEELDLMDYRPVVIDDESDVAQYIGFLSPNGAWYIVYNDYSNKEMLYAFGNKNFVDGWGRHPELDYKMLDEAVSEVQA